MRGFSETSSVCFDGELSHPPFTFGCLAHELHPQVSSDLSRKLHNNKLSFGLAQGDASSSGSEALFTREDSLFVRDGSVYKLKDEAAAAAAEAAAGGSGKADKSDPDLMAQLANRLTVPTLNPKQAQREALRCEVLSSLQIDAQSLSNR